MGAGAYRTRPRPHASHCGRDRARPCGCARTRTRVRARPCPRPRTCPRRRAGARTPPRTAARRARGRSCRPSATRAPPPPGRLGPPGAPAWAPGRRAGRSRNRFDCPPGDPIYAGMATAAPLACHAEAERGGEGRGMRRTNPAGARPDGRRGPAPATRPDPASTARQDPTPAATCPAATRPEGRTLRRTGRQSAAPGGPLPSRKTEGPGALWRRGLSSPVPTWSPELSRSVPSDRFPRAVRLPLKISPRQRSSILEPCHSNEGCWVAEAHFRMWVR